MNGSILTHTHDALLEWRKHITIVSQDSPMFRRTIRENITYGLGDVMESELEEALEKTCLSDWLKTMPEGLDTVLTDREHQLSGGQRQRVQICRALLNWNKIVFMVSVFLLTLLTTDSKDEPTASLDPQTKEVLLTNLSDFFDGKTVVCITHDISMLRLFTNVYHLSLVNGLTAA